jgi:protein ImuB
MTRRNRRMVTVWCPDWPVTASGIAPVEPVIVLHANRVVARSRAAAEEGVQIGQRRREAQHRCPDATLLAHDADRDARAFEPIVRAIAAFSPLLDVVEPGWLCLDARGPSRYFGGDHRLAEQLIDTVRVLASGSAPSGSHPDATTGSRGAVQVGIADGRFASAVAARRAVRGPVVVPPGGSPEVLAGLPVSWLQVVDGLDADLVGLFARLGLHRLGDLAALPAADVLARFGPAGAHAHRIAAGRDRRPVNGAEPPPHRVAEQRFEDPVDQLDMLVFTAKRLADELSGRLALEGHTCTRLVVTAETDHQERSERVWYRAAGMSAPAMVDRARWQLASWIASGDLTAGAVVLRLQVVEVRDDDGEQGGLWGGVSAADQRAVRAVTRLAGMVGDDAVLVPAWRGGHLPHDRYEWVPATTCDLTSADDTTERLRPRPRDIDSRTGPWPGSIPPPSPIVLHPEPRPAQLVGHGDRPLRVTGRGELEGEPVTLAVAGGRPRAVTGWAGPWPLDEQWWSARQRRRVARLQVLTDDGAAHLVIAERQRWWVIATYA